MDTLVTHQLSLQIKLLIGRQRFLECISWQNGGSDRHIYPPWRPWNDGRAVDESTQLNILVDLLNEIKPYCSVPVSLPYFLYFYDA